jgi:hypothetical protein
MINNTTKFATLNGLELHRINGEFIIYTFETTYNRILAEFDYDIEMFKGWLEQYLDAYNSHFGQPADSVAYIVEFKPKLSVVGE